MMNERKMIWTLLLVLYHHGTMAQIWPDGKKAAIVLSYDDGLKSQLEIVVPQLDERGFKGTFFLFGAAMTPGLTDCWREVAKRGHELGNHSLYHPCLSGGKDSLKANCRGLECYTLKDALKEVSMMDEWLYAIDGKKNHSYAYPCGQSQVMDGDYADSLKTIGIKYARNGTFSIVVSDLKHLNISRVPTCAIMTGTQSETMIDFVEEAISKGGLCVFVFHGVGGDYLTVDAEEHRKLLDYLKWQENHIWVGTFSEILEYVSLWNFEISE